MTSSSVHGKYSSFAVGAEEEAHLQILCQLASLLLFTRLNGWRASQRSQWTK